ncbi:MAG: radical SAM protein [Ignavibacteriaceae bacterium]|jgi:putative pyruvate formate lyase activating enzyme
MNLAGSSYIKLNASGEFLERVQKAEEILKTCTSCPKNCLTDRTVDELGKCLSGYLPVVSSYTAHFGEEPVLSGTNGAGNIFFGNCNLRCIFCQNFEISQNWKVEKEHEVSFERLAEIMLELQNRKCHNIGLVSPTHFSAQILKSIYLAVEKGLSLPIIYNTNGYDSVEMLKLYKDVADIYLPDFKYGNSEFGKQLSKVDNYVEQAKLAVKEMYEQVGDELIYQGDVVVRGLIIRHLVLPNDLSESEKVFAFIAKELSPKIHISVMSQYFPSNKAEKEILINRTIRASEYERVLDLLDKYNLKNGWTQEFESEKFYRPEFRKNRIQPFKL